MCDAGRKERATMSESNDRHDDTKRYAIVCGTPLQLMGALALCLNEFAGDDASVDLFFRHDFSGSHALVSRVKDIGAFEHVYEIGADSDEPFSIRGNESDELPADPIAMLDGQLGHGCDDAWSEGYDVVLCSYPYDTVKALWRLRRDTVLMVFDDGLGSYVGDMMASNGGASLPHPSRLYLWRPSLYRGEMCDDVRPVPFDCGDADTMATLYAVFDVDEDAVEQYRSARCVYLTQPTDGKPGRLREKEMVLSALEPWRSDVIVRPHPRDVEPHAVGFSYDESGMLWELLCLIGVIDADTVLVSAVSTAQLMPMMLTGEKPPIVVTLGVTDAVPCEAELDVISLMRDAYDGEGFYSPHSVSELSSQLGVLLG